MEDVRRWAQAAVEGRPGKAGALGRKPVLHALLHCMVLSQWRIEVSCLGQRKKGKRCHRRRTHEKQQAPRTHPVSRNELREFKVEQRRSNLIWGVRERFGLETTRPKGPNYGSKKCLDFSD